MSQNQRKIQITTLHLLLGDVDAWAVLGAAVHILDVLDRPGEGRHEGHDQVDQGPADDDVVVGDDAEGGDNRGQTDSGEARVDATEDTDVTALEFLAESELHECNGDADGEEASQVGHEEESATPGEAEVGEAPEVSEADTVADHSEDEGHAGEPPSSLRTFVFVCEALDARLFATHL